MSKRYRRKHNDFEITGTYFPDLETGPIVILQPGDFDAIEVPWPEFKAEWEEVPEVKRVGEDVEVVGPDVSETAERTAHDLRREDAADFCYFHVNGRHVSCCSVRGVLAILDAARKSLAEGDAGAERCRVGEWLPVGYLKGFAPKYSHLRAVCESEDATAAHFSMLKSGHLVYDAGSTKLDLWDAARDKWIADGRPTS